MLVYVMFVLIRNDGVATVQYEFKDKIQCENAVAVYKKRMDTDKWVTIQGYCQEVKK